MSNKSYQTPLYVTLVLIIISIWFCLTESKLITTSDIISWVILGIAFVFNVLIVVKLIKEIKSLKNRK